jgi:acyl-CoA reductase-like NAD-dependent aldehyde dehydrogenase
MSGQKCSACSRLYISSSLWNSGFKDRLLGEVKKIKVGPIDDFSNFVGPVMFVMQPFVSPFGALICVLIVAKRRMKKY